MVVIGGDGFNDGDDEMTAQALLPWKREVPPRLHVLVGTTGTYRKFQFHLEAIGGVTSA